MTKTLKWTMIIAAMITVMALAAAPVSAAEFSQVVGVDIQSDNVTTKVGSNVSLKASYQYVGAKPSKKISWSSSDTKVATVAGGQVVAKKKGKVTITAELEGQTDTCTVVVNEAPAKFVNASGCYTALNKYRADDKKAQITKIKKSKMKKVKKAKSIKKINKKYKTTLKRDAELEKIAKVRAEEMAKSGKFSHTRPNGKSGLTLIKGNVYKGENIAMGQRTCDQVSVAWFQSPGHKKNMLKQQYTKVGIAGYEYNGVIYWAQVFSS